MNIYFDYDCEYDDYDLFSDIKDPYLFPFSERDLVRKVVEYAFQSQNCPYENRSVNVLFTDNEGIHSYNKEYRGIDRETDVLSFPNLEFEVPGEFQVGKEDEANCFDPETGELLLGDIILSVDRIRSQALDYGHSVEREMAFLVAHSCLHLSGYDHMTEEEAKIMEEKQEAILAFLGITRD